MELKTKIFYLLMASVWLYGWFSLEMRLEFLMIPVIFIVLIILNKNENIGGILFFLGAPLIGGISAYRITDTWYAGIAGVVAGIIVIIILSYIQDKASKNREFPEYILNQRLSFLILFTPFIFYYFFQIFEQNWFSYLTSAYTIIYLNVLILPIIWFLYLIVSRREMQEGRTKLKDAFFKGILYLLIPPAWLYGWFSLGMRWEFLMIPVIFILLISLQSEIGGILFLLGTLLIGGLSAYRIFDVWYAGIAGAVAGIIAIDIINNITKSYFEEKEFPEHTIHHRISFLILATPFIFFYIPRFLLEQSWFSYIVSGYTILLLFDVISLPSYWLMYSIARTSQHELKILRYLVSYPHLYCPQHSLRPRKIKKNIFFSDIICRGTNCSQKFETGVEKVVGLIGGDIKNYKIDKERVYVNLWNEDKKEGRNADIDVLEIRSTGNITYKFAIDAVSSVLKNDLSRSKELKEIPVIIDGKQELDMHSKKTLKENFGDIKNE